MVFSLQNMGGFRDAGFLSGYTRGCMIQFDEHIFQMG